VQLSAHPGLEFEPSEAFEATQQQMQRHAR
jgi:hypothetical protein